MAKPHYYRLDGRSLAALNKLIEYDRLMTDFRMTDLRTTLAELFGKDGPEEDPAALQSRLSLHFTSAQVKTYKETLGFNAPPVQVRDYDNGTVRRAYHVLPKIAMNPGTSKANFGIGDMFKNSSRAADDRLAIYTAYEDYTGAHFAPPGAIKMTDAEFAAYHPHADAFEYYRTYDEGTEMPADFDAARHQTQPRAIGDLSTLTHVFLVQDAANDALTAYNKARRDWFMPYQDFRDKALPGILGRWMPNADRLTCYVEPEENHGGRRIISFSHLSVSKWQQLKDDLSRAFDLVQLIEQPMDGRKALMTPRLDTPEGREVAEALTKVPPHPVAPVDFGFETRQTLQNRAVFDDKMSGFPYMKIERYDDGDVKLLVFRLPPNIKAFAAPEICSTLSIEDYAALAGPDDKPPTHVFRIEGEAYRRLAEYDAAMKAYQDKSTAFQDYVTKIFRAAAPGLYFDEFRLREYKTNAPRFLNITFPENFYPALESMLKDHFDIQYEPRQTGPQQDRITMQVIPQRKNASGEAMADAIDAVPYEPDIDKKIDQFFGFYANRGYDHMRLEELNGTGQNAVVYNFPAYINAVDPPQNCIALTREEYIWIVADSEDVRTGSPLPPRPDHLRHLPWPAGAQSYERVLALKTEKDESGLPLHERTEYSWFDIKVIP